MKQELKQAPYGEPSFVELREQGYAYVDKTSFIPALERCGTRFPFIVRPRRFGKSVFANMLIAYYDKAAAGDFEHNFAGTWIGEHPTPLASKYLILKFDFSGIDGSGEALIASFMTKVKAGMRRFIRQYLPDNQELKSVINNSYATPSALLTDFLSITENSVNDDIYLIIDEYDQFAQNVLSASPEEFRLMTGPEGFLKAFYAVIKDFTQTIIKRTFITGVTSISLDSMTSGFNIAKNRTTYSPFAALMGFTETELRELIPQIIDLNRYERSADDVFDRMKILYNGYRFSPDSDVTVFNSSMCLYYLGEIAERNHEPAFLLDPSFSVDLSKIDGILSLGSRSFVESIVSDIVFDRSIRSLGISEAINLNLTAGLSERDVLTALLCMGFLTFSSADSSRLVCPNRVVKDLFLQYWFWRIEHLKTISFEIETQEDAIAALARGDVRPLLDFVAEALGRSVGGHAHAHLSETAIQLAVVMAVNTCPIYRVTAEEEALGAGYTDLILRPAKEHPDAAGWLIEFKYLRKTDASQEATDEKIREAEAQLQRYSAAENIAEIPNLHRAAAVFAGTQLAGLKVF